MKESFLVLFNPNIHGYHEVKVDAFLLQTIRADELYILHFDQIESEWDLSLTI